MRTTSAWLTIRVGALLAAGCFGPGGSNGAPDGGPDGGAAGRSDAGGGECSGPGDCRLVDDRCCPCAPPVITDTIRAVPVDSNDFGMQCRVACGPCPELPPAPVTVIADCVAGLCTPVELTKQPYTQCELDSDCQLRPVDCCGWCSLATIENSYAINTRSDFDACSQPVACPDIECPPVSFAVEAFCNVDGACFVRPPPGE